MSLRSSRMYGAAAPKMPPGLVELMEGLAKDVLKNSPNNIYEFCVQHFKKLIEIRDGFKAPQTDSSLIQKSSTVQDKDQGKAEPSQSLNDIGMVAVNTYNGAGRDELEGDEKQIPQIDETDDTSFNNDHKSEKGIELEHQQTQMEDSFDSNRTETVASVGDNYTIRISETIKEISHSPETKKNSMDKNSLEINVNLTKNLASFNSNNEIIDIIEPVLYKTCFENENTLTNETDLLNADLESTNDHHLEIVTESVGQIKFENTEYDLNLGNVNILQKDASRNEIVLNDSNNIRAVEISINDISSDSLGVIKHKEMDKLPLEDRLHIQKTSETEDSDTVSPPDVDNDTANSMDLEKAAITIQKVFRAFLFKSKTLSTDEITNVDLNYLMDNEDKQDDKDANIVSKERRSGLSRMDTVLQTVNEEKSLSLSTDDSSTLSSAATVIQAHVRGFLVRCKMPFNKTTSTVSVLDSDIPSAASFDSDQNHKANKTILNIHIVPEGNNFISRDESLITSLDLSLDGSPRHSSNLHPLGYDISERRKQLKREDAIQSVTPPSNNSGKLSEEVDSVKEVALNDSTDEPNLEGSEKVDEFKKEDHVYEFENHETKRLEKPKHMLKEMRSITSDEADVVTPLITDGAGVDTSSKSTSKLLHSGEFHDIVLPTMVSRNNSSVVREFQNVLVYFLLWNPS